MTGKYSLICDPPWSYGNTISNGAAADHYSTMKLIDIKRLPVWELAAENAVLAMWYTGTHNQEAIELAEAWIYRSHDEGLYLGEAESERGTAHQQGAGRG
jgi:N6-adenosine-specific RNA methylase IME4